MSTVVDFDAPTSARPNSGVATDPLGRKDDAITFRPRAAGSSFFWAMQFLPYQRREAMLWQKIENFNSYAALVRLLTTETAPEHRQPGSYMVEALKYRDQWESRLLRTSSWLPLY